MPGKMSPDEEKFADFLDSKGLGWEYEPKRFEFGETAYIPDFYVPSERIYYEVVGTRITYLEHVRKGDFEKMGESYPDVNLKIVYSDGRPYPLDIGENNRKPIFDQSRSIRLRMSGEMIDEIDQSAAETPEANRSSMIRTFCREGLKQREMVKGGMPGKSVN